MEEEKRVRTRRRNSNEEEIKPKRVRGSRTSVSLEDISKTPTRTRNKQESHPLLRSNYDTEVRLQKYVDYHPPLEPKTLQSLFTACYKSNRESVERAINDHTTSIGELQAIVLNMDAIDSESTTSLRSKQYIDTRLFGKPAEKVEHTGANGGAIQVENKKKELDLDDLTEEQLIELHSVMKMLMAKEAEQEAEEEKDK